MSRLAPDNADTIGRLLALGYTEAKRRPAKQPSARLDALFEATIAVCDLLAPVEIPKEAFYVSVVGLFDRQANAIRSSLAPFDTDVRNKVEALATGWELITTRAADFRLEIPRAAVEAKDALVKFWQSAIIDLNLDIAALSRKAPPPQLEPPDSKSSEEFGRSLRHALDAMLLDEWGIVEDEQAAYRPFALRLHACEPPSTIEGTPIPYALGYWLPTVVLHHLTTRPKDAFTLVEIQQLERPQTPAFGKHARSQSHTNIETGLACLVRNQGQRSNWLRDPTESPAAHLRTSFPDLDALEKKAWGERQPDHVFLMPIRSDHLALADSDVAVPVAHWYAAVVGVPDLEWLLALRHRTSVIFAQSLVRRYQNAVARELAHHFFSGDRSDLNAANRRLKSTAIAYGLPSAVDITPCERGQQAAQSQLQQILALPIDVGRNNLSDEWAVICARQLASSSLKFADTLSHRDQVGILVRLVRALDAEVQRTEVTEHLERELDEIGKKLAEVQAQRETALEIVRPDRDAEQAWKRLESMGEFLGDVAFCKSTETKPPIEGWAFKVGHGACVNKCLECTQEQRLRVAFLCGAQLVSAIPDDAWYALRISNPRVKAFDAFASQYRGGPAWLIKRAIQPPAARNRPKLASVVVLALMAGASVKAVKETNLDNAVLAQPPRNWLRSLFGISKLAQPDADKEGHATIDMKCCADLVFTLTGDLAYHEWFADERTAATRGESRRLRLEKSRVQHIVKAYGLRHLPLDEGDSGVQIDLDGATLVCTWLGAFTKAAR